MGLISSIIDEPYFSTISEIIRIRTNRLIKIENEVLIDKIYNYIILYFGILAKQILHNISYK